MTDDAALRAGPGANYPRVAYVPEDARVRVRGCLRGYSWCDISWRGERGWVNATNLGYTWNNRRVIIEEFGPRIGLPVIGFAIQDYWSSHYRNRPWWSQRHTWFDRGRDMRDRDHRRGDWRDRDDRRREGRMDGRRDNDRDDVRARQRGDWSDRNDWRNDRQRSGNNQRDGQRNWSRGDERNRDSDRAGSQRMGRERSGDGMNRQRGGDGMSTGRVPERRQSGGEGARQ